MAVNQDKAYEVENGIIFSEDGSGTFSGSGSPQGNNAPVGSFYLDVSTGDVWTKLEPGIDGWSFRPDHLSIMDLDKKHIIREGESMQSPCLHISDDGYLKISGSLRIS